MGMTNIGCQRKNSPIHLDPFLVKAQDAANDIGVAHVLEPVMEIVATRLPIQVLAQATQRIVDVILADPTTIIEQEEMIAFWVQNDSVAQLGV